ncbi:MAG: hypothetical protein HZA66_13095 [Rhodopseudomonas palustris]|uniref:Uncharacterized protein n=1 Tax=Rhodopseudomonas palustris TaxID=1076 RepID=A0A933VVZ1_RHOPL|nr:hypothetical protein [Rhodopseudomonas palustris]
MTSDLDAAAPDSPSAKSVLDRLRADLAAPAADDLQTLLKIGGDLDALDHRHLGVDEAAAWQARPETRREYIRAMLARQSGFRLGLLVGFGAGFVLTGLFGAMLAMHYVVVHQP